MAKKANRPARRKRSGPASAPAPVQGSAPIRTDEQGALDDVRALIAAELAAQEAIEKSRQPLALIAEASIRLADPALGPGYVVVDLAGEARVHEDGTPHTIADLVAGLRREHPNLFLGTARADAASDPAAALGHDAVSEAPAPIAQGEFDLSVPPPQAGPEPVSLPVEAPAAVRMEAAAAGDEHPVPPALPALPADDPLPAAASLEPAAAPPSERPHEHLADAARPLTSDVPLRPLESSRPRKMPSAGSQPRPRRGPMLPPAWMPSRAAWLRILYLAAFVGGLAAYSAVRHFA